MSANPKHVARAEGAIARELCAAHFTDGFCQPDARPDCRCVNLAKASVRAMETVGVMPVWVFDPKNSTPSPSVSDGEKVTQ